MTTITFTIGLRTESPNRVRGTTRGAAMARRRQIAFERECATMGTCRAVVLPRGEFARMYERPGRIVLERLSAGMLDDDNLRAALKAVRDGVAAGLGYDDGWLTWAYAQRKVKRGVFGVEVRIERREETAA